MKNKWWHNKVAYQIYPKSFKDTNGDGIGDIRGIIEKLDYLNDLGIDIIWICPIYKSPFVDQGYDISDYYSIAPEFGTMEEFDTLLEEAKKRNMYIVMDLVINHCSDQHEWFQKALAEPEGEYADYFYFIKGKNGNPPSNYRSYFGGSVWEPVKDTDKYYLHMFAKEQPDLNWNNPKVKEELFKMINWWLQKGVAGFRIDAIINIKKNLEFPSYPPDGEDGLVRVTKMVEEVDGVGEMLQELKHETFDKFQAFTVAEVFNMKEDELAKFIGDNGHFSTMFDFSAHILTDGKNGWYDSKPLDFCEWRNVTFQSQQQCQGIGFLANIIENHDEPRGACTYLPDYAQNDAGIKMLATTSILLRGIPFIYQGQEIGMRNCKMKSIDEYDDISTKDQYKKALDADLSIEEALNACYAHSRDNARTPMQWSSKDNAGFTEGNPWIKVNPNYSDINVESQLKDEKSVLRYYQKLISLRKSEKYGEIFTYGDFIPAYLDHEKIYAYYRQLGNQKILIAANFSQNGIALKMEHTKTEVLLSNMDIAEPIGKTLTLESCQAVVLQVD
ncbi:oligo-1,6-glucosidase [Clostridium pasteurianum DSM 525 = ATCC 6013]|uniref:Oligo-1,6-glucosidase n=1 Tax=Clostridium pasteurianum DSM 525 = ATCC 6013 TaxID=1262449 RepID=A0A0H3J687_CLOPA|nr:alpha-glucosidase [Clostridium pasteurianum]AJA46455.1 oligo-1,6-glucosidase [Clostridium pasteurianum DSM 525 = ATCC 6013]AJA50443.1 oligo-1,6-glucosidase [Clostridium pasteurianum DSM 525 = ATCC 6013]AOZ73887.1 alpha-glucosidase [Clostridium pasteurianum DSM 525 = ATCC 6013]AOZ77684.1 alpha-glucosidase [Clostridium pasteurianum]ELP61030.1 oligo-1,6-glucosidase [Clostridium pasteurianum DSM 525 = ATCC 6013]